MPDKLVYNGVYGSISVADGTPSTPLTVELDTAAANFSLSNLSDGVLNEEAPVEVRGRLVGLAPGARIYPEVSFEVVHVDVFSAAGREEIAAMILGMDDYKDRVSTLGSGHFRTTLDVTFDLAVDGAPQKIELTDVALKIDSWSEGDPSSTWTISGTVYGTVSINGTLVADEISLPSP